MHLLLHNDSGCLLTGLSYYICDECWCFLQILCARRSKPSIETVLKHCTGGACIPDDLHLLQQSQPHAPIKSLDLHRLSRPCAPHDAVDPETDLTRSFSLCFSGF
ncbi:unnamed protein product [Effrenium voratum]|uniref:Uncharacterized protein n=1 Tax=Effrenium voratum TaxID=2562239 RepID=A0AA36JG51_9DINO|nr:unnamed protein product [Effrenium voratum]CAJ1416203.1 unnamed protein product [Effrenium voratum]